VCCPRVAANQIEAANLCRCLRCGSNWQVIGAHSLPFQILGKGSDGSSKPVDLFKPTGNLVPIGER